jgi:hypothetical protein
MRVGKRRRNEGGGGQLAMAGEEAGCISGKMGGRRPI